MRMMVNYYLPGITFNAKSVAMSGNAVLYQSSKNDVIDIKLDYIDLTTLFAKPNFRYYKNPKILIN
jgi:hypothetical protein